MPNSESGAEVAPSDRAKQRTRRPKRKWPAPSSNARRAVGRWRHTYAAVDLGTNNCRLLVAKPTREGFRVVDAFSRTVRLGEGVEATGILSDRAIERAVAALKICASKIRRRGVTRTRAIATEACRLAHNGRDFIQLVEKETGLILDIIPADEEARLAVAGCSSLLESSYDGALIFDIGGGSTEMVWLDYKRADDMRQAAVNGKSITAWTSLPLGVVNLAERYSGADTTCETFERMVEEVTEHLSSFDDAQHMRDAFADGRVQMLGTSGTVTTLAALYLGLEKYDRAKVDGVWIGTREVRQICQRLAGMTYDERVAEPCIGEDRADLVTAGCAIFEAISRLWPTDRLRVADRGLREGILLVLMDKADREGPRHRKRRRKRPKSDGNNDQGRSQ